MNHVVLLGAGFSRALSESMLLLKELGQRVVAKLGGQGGEDLERFGGDVEEYLTFIGADQPWLSEEENLLHRALFGETVAALREVIAEAQREATDAHLPQWLERVAWQWSRDRAAVLTFNYDTLLEEPLRVAGGIGTLADLYVVPLTERIAPGVGSMFTTNAPTKPYAELYKLHGSINWLHGGDAAPVTDPIILDYRTGERSSAPRDDRIYGGLKTFIIPPTSVKNRYYDRVGLREQWIQAAARLQAADHLTVIGYSLPASDVGSSSFLRTNLNPGARIEVVDFAPAVAHRFGSLLNRPTYWHPSVSSWLDDRVADRIEWWATDVAETQCVPHLSVNGVEQLIEPPRAASPEEFGARVRAQSPDLVEVESTVSTDGIFRTQARRVKADAPGAPDR
ncbi:hypothetical protein [uncultured Amnibacterium sp.]|uniref:hypothetical protein n=1 Tax=uncultured Amnibacterium sp. TaxID=1631851 RepID=UPI0035CAB18B